MHSFSAIATVHCSNAVPELIPSFSSTAAVSELPDASLKSLEQFLLPGQRIHFDIYELRDKKGLLSTWSPSTLAFLTIKNLPFVLNTNLLRIQRALDELDEDEDVDFSLYFSPQNSQFGLNLFNGFLSNMRFALSRDIITLQINRIYESLLLPFVRLRTAKALIKNMAHSAMRKARRYPQFSFEFGTKVFASSLRSQMLYFASVFTFNVGLNFYHLRKEESTMTKKEKQVAIGKIIGFNLVQTTKTWIFASIGAALGSYVRPGIGTMIGLNAGPILFEGMISSMTHRPKNM